MSMRTVGLIAVVCGLAGVLGLSLFMINSVLPGVMAADPQGAVARPDGWTTVMVGVLLSVLALFGGLFLLWRHRKDAQQ